MAQASGIAWVGVNGSNHAGAGGIYAAQIARSGLIGIYGAVAGLNHMAPAGGSEPLLGTNPLAIAIPRPGDQSLLLDIAMSAASFGAVRNAALIQAPMPVGWMVDRHTGAP